MLSLPIINSFSPISVRPVTKFSSHQVNDTVLTQIKLVLDGVKRGSILPRHFYYPRHIGDCKIFQKVNAVTFCHFNTHYT